MFLRDVRPVELDPPQTELAFAAAYWRSLHLIDALLADPMVQIHPANDAERFEAMRGNGRFSRLYKPYRNLKDRYAEAMYQGREFTAYDFSDDVFEDAESIRKIVERVLGLAP